MTEASAFRPKKSVALSGVTAGNTALCTVGRTGNDLHYRGYDILEIANVCEFEEIAYLLIHEKLPNRAELGAVGELLVDQEVRDLLELADVRDLQDVVAAIVQIVAGAPDRAQRGVTRRHARQRHGLLGPEGARLSHRSLSRTAHRASSRRRGSRACGRARRVS